MPPWSDWYQIQDEALNGIWFSWKCDSDRCEYRMDNRYTTPVKIRYSLRLINSDGIQRKFSAEQRLATGVNESAVFALAATRELKGVEVEIIEPKYTGPRSSKYVPSSTAEVDAEKKRQAAIIEAEAREAREREQVRLAHEREQAEEQQRRREEREERRSRDDAELNQIITSGIQGLGQQFNSGMQQLNDIDRQNAQRQAEQRRQQEEQRRENQRIQRQQENDRRERERVALLERQQQERARKAEAARQEEQARKEAAHKEEERKEREEQERKQKEEEQRYTTPISASCLETFYDKEEYGWLAVRNNCTKTLHVEMAYSNDKHGGGGWTIRPGRHENTGRSRKEIEAAGSYVFAVCPEGYNPIGSDDGFWKGYGHNYRCKK
ncbi:MAG: hypothetical protein WCP20_16305 [Desulfuromonadales bacterium]